jgi:hypothetical protein
MPSRNLREIVRFIQLYALKAIFPANHEQNGRQKPSARSSRKRRSRTDSLIDLLTTIVVILAVAILAGLTLILLVWGACYIMLPQLIGLGQLSLLR